jgi:hypothetical protein
LILSCFSLFSARFPRYFRPYHPIDIYRKNPKYGWNNYLKWSNYDIKQANHDETEYDLYYCVNNGGGKSSECSMDHGDVSQPLILYRSNRVYLCRYEKEEGSRDHQELREILGVNASTDLYEVAGCLLRLALWPTDELWQDIDESYYQDLYSRILYRETQTGKKEKENENENEKEKQRKRKERKLRRILKENKQQEGQNVTENEGLDGLSVSNHRRRRSLIEQQSQQSEEGNDKKSKFRFVDETPPEEIEKKREEQEEEDRQIISEHSSHHHNHNHQSSSPSSLSSSQTPPFFQIGVHFRCGDHGYAHQANEYDCAYDPNHHSENSYMLEGNPYELSLCVNELLHNHTLELIQNHRVIMSGKIVSLSFSHFSIFFVPLMIFVALFSSYFPSFFYFFPSFGCGIFLFCYFPPYPTCR